jgi:DNA-binding NtrC family response regulator
MLRVDERISGVMERALPSSDVVQSSDAPTPLWNRPRSMANVIGESAPMRDLYALVDRIADTNCTVLVTGESGSGKELVARALHEASSRAREAFVPVNCGAIPATLLESELFGHVKGAFTGAHVSRRGRLAQAEGGTLFLDEIGELSPALQVKLLRILQHPEYSPVGETRTLCANVRIVAATNIDLEQAVADGSFREDLYYRLNVIHLHVPALRDRTEDIAPLALYFLEQAAQKTGRSEISLSPAALETLLQGEWPGNVRELENTVERAVILTASSVIEANDLAPAIRASRPAKTISTELPEGGLELRQAVEAFENGLIRQALERTGWNKNQAARLLGLNRTTLVEMLKRKRITSRAA